MSVDADGLRAAILAAPQDTSQWLIYADWLGEHALESAGDGVRSYARQLCEGASVITRHITLHASCSGTGQGHTAFCDAMHAAELGEVTSEAARLISANYQMLMNTEAVLRVPMSGTFYELDELSVGEASFSGHTCTARFSFTLSGDRDLDRWYRGEIIAGSGVLTVTVDGKVCMLEVMANAEHANAADQGDDGEPVADEE